MSERGKLRASLPCTSVMDIEQWRVLVSMVTGVNAGSTPRHAIRPVTGRVAGGTPTIVYVPLSVSLYVYVAIYLYFLPFVCVSLRICLSIYLAIHILICLIIILLIYLYIRVDIKRRQCGMVVRYRNVWGVREGEREKICVVRGKVCETGVRD